MSIKPWICNGSRTIVKDRWIDLHADDCALPDGTKISPFYVNDVPDFVVVVAVTVDGDFVFVRQYRHGTRQILLELPAGCMEPVGQGQVVVGPTQPLRGSRDPFVQSPGSGLHEGVPPIEPEVKGLLESPGLLH